MTYPLRRSASDTPLLPWPDDEHAFLFDVLPTVRSRAEVARIEASCAAIFEHATHLGARVYPIGFPVGSERMDWPHQLGDAWSAFVTAKRSYDPEGGLTPGLGIFG